MNTRNKRQYVFGPFRLDVTTQQMWRGEALLSLQPRPFAVLSCLLARAGEVVDSTTLLKDVWGPTYVGKAALKVCIRAVREALGDDVATPRYIETVGRIGYRFIAPVALTPPHHSLESSVQSLGPEGSRATLPVQTLDARPLTLDISLVGRDIELMQLRRLFEKAVQGERQLVFVTGEAGIGKTTLVDSFLQTHDINGWIGWGQCLEQYGEGEAYLPVLEALGQLCRGPDGPQVLAVLRQMAPTWVAQLPQWVSAEEAEALQAKVLGATPVRMLREMAEALEALAAQRPMVLVLEDLHWSDRSTLDLLAYVAQRRERAQLYVIGTYRSAEAATSELPLTRLKNLSQTYGQCSELPLTQLAEEEVAAYVQRRFAGRSLPGELVGWLHRRSEGNALFMVALADYYIQERQLSEESVPATLQQLIAHQLTRLTAVQQQVVEGASVAGVEFGSAVVAAGIDVEPEAVDEVCAELSQTEQLVKTVGMVEWPDGTLSGRYRFCHALYQGVLYQRLPEVRRVRLHRRMGGRLEAGYEQQARERAAELAVHFERGRVREKAVTYHQLAGENALRRSTYPEAVLHATKGLALAKRLGQSPTRLAHELQLQLLLASGLMAIKGHTDGEVEEAYLRAQALCEQVGDTERLFFIYLGLARVYGARSDYQRAQEYAEKSLAVAAQEQNAMFFLGGHYVVGTSAFHQGMLAAVQTRTEQALAFYDPTQHQTYIHQYGFNPMIGCLLYGAITLWLRGYPDQAARRIAHTFSLAHELTHPRTQVFAYCVAAVGSQCLRRNQALVTQAERSLALARKHGLPFWVASSIVLAGWGQAACGRVDEGVEQMRTGLASMLELGARVHRAHYLTLLAEAVGKTGDHAQALQLVEDALAETEQSGERFYAAETWRIKGELLLAQSNKKRKSKGKSKKEARG